MAKSKLRDYQSKYSEKLFSEFSSGKFLGTIPTGSGCTIITIDLIRKIKEEHHFSVALVTLKSLHFQYKEMAKQLGVEDLEVFTPFKADYQKFDVYIFVDQYAMQVAKQICEKHEYPTTGFFHVSTGVEHLGLLHMHHKYLSEERGEAFKNGGLIEGSKDDVVTVNAEGSELRVKDRVILFKTISELNTTPVITEKQREAWIEAWKKDKSPILIMPKKRCTILDHYVKSSKAPVYCIGEEQAREILEGGC